jgi:exodeoxyribonuclease V alpha subunit
MIQEYDIIHEEGRIYTKHNYHVEHVVASKFVELIKIDKMVKNIPNIGGKKYTIFGKHDLTDQQLMALEGCLKYNLCVVTGGAGCGKTTLLLEIVKNLEKTGRKVVLTSFTGKAVMRIKEVLDSPKEYDEKCVTLHRLIHRKKTYQKIPRFDVLVIDEASMVSTGLLFQFFSLFTEPFRIILIGDCNQLEPVESGSLLREIIDSELVPTYRLTKNKRTDNSGSMIIKNASGLVSPDRNFDIPFRFSSGEGLYMVSGGIEKIRKIIKSLSGAGIDDKSMTVLSPVNKYIQEITRFHQKYYLRKSEKYSYRDVFYHIGDRMMQKKNYYSDDFEIMNGEEGYIVEINEDFLEIDFGNKKISYGWESRDKNSRKEEDATDGDDLTVDSISHSFCKTIHKSQGSEYEYVIVFLPPDQYNFVTLNMLYTAVTRAKKSVWIVGEQSTVDIVTTKTQKKRYETLSEKMKKMF